MPSSWFLPPWEVHRCCCNDVTIVRLECSRVSAVVSAYLEILMRCCIALLFSEKRSQVLFNVKFFATISKLNTKTAYLIKLYCKRKKNIIKIFEKFLITMKHVMIIRKNICKLRNRNFFNLLVVLFLKILQ